MKLIIRLILSICALHLYLSKNVESANILPTLPDQVEIPFATTHIAEYFANVVFNQTNTIISRLNPLEHEFTYNCLSGNFIMALHLDNSTTAEASYSFDGRVDTFLGPVPMTASGHVSLYCGNDEDGRCFRAVYGKIVEEEGENGETKLVAKGTSIYFFTRATVDGGTVGDLPIGESGEYFIDIAKMVANEGVVQNTIGHLESYINDIVLKDMTMDELVTLTHGTCVGGSDDGRSSIIPDLPDDFEFEPVTLYRIDSYNNISFEHHRTFSELLGMKHDFTFNCMTTGFEVTVLASKNVSAHGQFYLNGYFGYDVKTNFTATGVMRETCPIRDEFAGEEDDELGCFLTASGYIKKNEETGGVIASTFGMFWPAKIEFEVDSAVVNGHDWQDDEASAKVITSQLSDWTYDDRNRLYDILEARLNQLLENTTMAELLAMTGGTCKDA